MDHPFFASVDWEAIKEHKVKPSFRPLDIIKLKFFKKKGRAPHNYNELIEDTRFFSPK
jgi:hypothetical protein